MADESRTAEAGAGIHEDHYCEHPGCKRWGCYGFEQDRLMAKWFCREHQPESYRGLPRHGVEA